MKPDIPLKDFSNCPRPKADYDRILLSHGSGGKLTHDLIERLFVAIFDNPMLDKQDDQAIVEVPKGRLSFTTDSYVVDPIFFPGGDIGALAVNGTVNDICMCGARPLFLSAGFIIEEGLLFEDLRKIVESMKAAADMAGVAIVTGDTKVVNKGKGDKVFINTSGIGVIEHEFGVAILSKREGIAFETDTKSDCAALNGLVESILKIGGAAVHTMRDPTRGGVAATLNEFAATSKVGIRIQESSIPVAASVVGACEMLGLDPLYVANEGKLVAAIAPERAEAVLAAMREHPLGTEAVIIGDVVAEQSGMVSLQTRLGAWRVVDMPVAEQLPRIC
jgi:hydrogenase expression/formation protein HypE